MLQIIIYYENFLLYNFGKCNLEKCIMCFDYLLVHYLCVEPKLQSSVDLQD